MAVDKRWHKKKRPHRRLRRGMRGDDVLAFQAGLVRRLAHIPGGHALYPKRDGIYGDQTQRAWSKVRWYIGLPGDLPPTRAAQRNVRDPRTRTPIARLRARRRRKGAAKPRIITARQIGLAFQWVWGANPYIAKGGAHYSASPSVNTAAELVAAVRSFHSYHRSLGWGGVSYPALIGDDGTIVLASPPRRLSAQVANQNTGMVGICIPGTTGDRITPEAEASLRWLLDHWHTSAVPAEHRLPRPARQLDWRVHREWPGQSTSCPGDMTPQYKELLP